MLKRCVLLAGLLSGLSAVACSDRAADLVAPFRQNAIAAGDSIFIHSGDAQVGRANFRLAKGLQIIVRNNGAPVADARGTFTVTAGGGSVSRTAFRTNASGIAQFTWTLGASGPQQVTAALNGGNSVVFTATVIPVGSTLSILLGNGQTALPGDTLAGNLIVELRDPLGTAIPGATVRFTTVAAHGGAAKFATRTTNTAGRALNRWMLGWGASAQTLKAFVPGVDTVTFNATTSTAGITFQALSGNAQSAPAYTDLANSLVVRLLKNGVPVEDVRTTFAVTQGGGSLSRLTAHTNVLGRATTDWTLGLGTQQVSATIGAVGTVTFDATAQNGIFFLDLAAPLPSSVMSRHAATAREIDVSFTYVNTTGGASYVGAFLSQNGSDQVGSPAQNVYCATYGVPVGRTNVNCTIQVPLGLTAGTYDLLYRMNSGGPGMQVVVPAAVTVDDTNPLTIDTVSLSRSTVQASDPATHIVTAREVATSSQGITHMEANIYQVDGNFLSNGCVAYQDAAGTLSNTARSCGLWFAGKSPGVYNIRFSAYDKAGNIVHSHVVGAVTVVP